MHPYLDTDLPIAFAHRGGASDEPENTLASFQHAVSLGYRYLETDAHVTRDGTVVAFHDDVLDRVTDRIGAIHDLPLAEVRAADAAFSFSTDGGATFPHRGSGHRIPLLSEVLESWPDVRVNIDAKSDAVVVPLSLLLKRMGALDRVCVGSFSDARVTRVRRLCGAALCSSMGPAAVATARLASWTTGRMPGLGADCLQIPASTAGGRVPLADASLIRAAHRGGLQVHVWTIDEEAQMASLLDAGVDGLMTDRPEVLRALLVRRGSWHGG